jgi:hypothetical protein
MSKPILDVGIETFDGKSGRVRALFDSGAHVTVIREDRVPAGTTIVRRPTPMSLRTAARGGSLQVIGATILVVTIGDRMIQTQALVSPNLSQEMLIGAETMQGWDISIRNGGGHTSVEVGKDLRDPDVQEVD